MAGRQTVWRQGHLLEAGAAITLGLLEVEDRKLHAVVITHDCDLASEQESRVEVIVGKEVCELDPVYSNARHPRKLHLQFNGKDDRSLMLELTHDGRSYVEKRVFESLGEAARSSLKLDAPSVRTLKQWLAARYARPAFPDAFVRRLAKKISSKLTVQKKMEGLISSCHEHLAGLFVDLDEMRFSELSDGDAYPLSLQVVYYAAGGPNARVAAEGLACELESLFLSAFGSPESATEICVENCQAVADTSITLADLQKLDQWRLEHLSLAADPQEEFVGFGGLTT